MTSKKKESVANSREGSDGSMSADQLSERLDCGDVVCSRGEGTGICSLAERLGLSFQQRSRVGETKRRAVIRSAGEESSASGLSTARGDRSLNIGIEPGESTSVCLSRTVAHMRSCETRCRVEVVMLRDVQCAASLGLSHSFRGVGMERLWPRASIRRALPEAGITVVPPAPLPTLFLLPSDVACHPTQVRC